MAFDYYITTYVAYGQPIEYAENISWLHMYHLLQEYEPISGSLPSSFGNSTLTKQISKRAHACRNIMSVTTDSPEFNMNVEVDDEDFSIFCGGGERMDAAFQIAAEKILGADHNLKLMLLEGTAAGLPDEGEEDTGLFIVDAPSIVERWSNNLRLAEMGDFPFGVKTTVIPSPSDGVQEKIARVCAELGMKPNGPLAWHIISVGTGG